MTANEAIAYLNEVLTVCEIEKQGHSEMLRNYEEEAQELENKLTAIRMGIGAIELCEKAKERS